MWNSPAREVVNTGLVVRYYMDEAGQGVGPTVLEDNASTPLDLDINYDSMIYATYSSGRGILFSSTSSSGYARYMGVGGSKIDTMLNGSKTLTLEIVANFRQCYSDYGRTLWIDSGTASGRVAFGCKGSSSNHLLVAINGSSYEFSEDATSLGENVFHIVVDTNLGTAADRIKLYRNGAFVENASSNIAQNTTISISSGDEFYIGNRDGGGRSNDSDISYVAIYNTAMSVEDIANNSAILIADHDRPGLFVSPSTLEGSENIVAIYNLEEATSGTGPAAAIDQTFPQKNLMLSYGSELSYTSNAQGGGLQSTTTATNGGASLVISGTDFLNFTDKEKATFEVVVDPSDCGASPSRIMSIENASSVPLALSCSTSGTDHWVATVNGQDIIFNDSNILSAGVQVVHFVFNSEEVTNTDRVKIYVDGSALTYTSGTLPSQGDQLTMSDDMKAILLNDFDGGNSIQGTLYYSAFYVDALSSTEITAHNSLLQADNALPIVSVDPLFPSAGKWNQYVHRSSISHFESNSNTCTSIDSGYGRCLHGGQMKKVVLSDYTSCLNMTLVETLDVFNWLCHDNGGSGPVTFYSTGLKETKRLSDLLNASSWKNNSVVIKLSGTDIAYSVLAPWWENSVYNLDGLLNTEIGATSVPGVTGIDVNTDGDLDVYEIDSEYSIYTLTTNKSLVGFNLKSNSLGLSIFPGVTLSYLGQTGNDNNTNSGSNAVGDSYVALLASPANRFLWVEGTFNGKGVVQRVITTNSALSRYRYVNVFDTPELAFSISNNSNLFQFTRASGGQLYGFHVAGQYNTSLKLTADNSQRNLSLESTSNNSTFLLNTLVSASGSAAYSNTAAPENLAWLGSSVQSAQFYARGDNFKLLNTLMMNTSYLKISDSDNFYVYNFISQNSSNNGLQVQSNVSASFKGQLWIGNPASFHCNIDASATINLSDGLGLCSSADPELDINNAQDITSSFATQVMNTDDASNDHVSNSELDGGDGTIVPGSIDDWTHFDNPWRAFFNASSSVDFWDINNQDKCTTSTDCAVFDLRTKSSDSIVRNSNGIFIASATCPSSVYGDETITDSRSPSNTYLKNAIERFDDGYGDEDGLCESNEHCIYMPQPGSYIGEGSLSTCNFDDNGGTTNVIDVIMYGYSINGI